MLFISQVYEIHDSAKTFTVFVVVMIRFNVITESHPASLTKVTVAVLLELVYVFPSIHVAIVMALNINSCSRVQYG